MIKKLKQIAVTILIFVHICPVPVSAYENVFSGVERYQGMYFRDVAEKGENYWANDAIYQMSAFGIIQGFGDGLYRPEQNVTRAQALAFIYRAKACEDEAEALADEIDKQRQVYQNAGFSTREWSDGYIRLALSEGLITDAQYQDAFSVEPEVFDRNSKTTRQEIAFWIAATFGISPSYDNSLTDSYKDSYILDHNLKPYVNALINERIIAGFDNMINPSGFLTRAEMAQILLNCESYITKKLGITVLGGTVSAAISENFVEIGDNVIVLDADKEEGLTVTANGKMGSLALLRAGDMISYYLNNENKVFFAKTIQQKITVTSESFITSGIVHSVRSKTIMLYDESGKADNLLLRRFTVSSNAIILKDNQNASLTDIKPYSRVFLKVADGVVIEISFSESVEGGTAESSPINIDNIYKAELSAYNKLTQAVSIKNVMVLDTDSWDYANHKGILELKVDTNTKLYYGDTVISLPQLNEYIGCELMIAAGSNTDLGEKVLFLRISESDSVLYNDKITEINTNKIKLSKKNITVGAGTIIVKDGQFITLRKISESDRASIAVGKSGNAYNAYFIIIGDSLDTYDVKIYYSRIKRFTGGNQIVLTVLREYDNVSKNIYYLNRTMTLKITSDTRFYNKDGIINNRNLNIWSNDSLNIYANVVVKDGEVSVISLDHGANLVLSAKAASILRDGNKITGLNIYYVWSYGNNDYCETMNNCVLNIKNNTIILKNGRSIGTSEVKAGDTVTAFYSEGFEDTEEGEVKALVIIIN